MDLAKILDVFKVFFTYNVPLGVCLLIIIVAFVLFQMLQSERRKDYKVNLDTSHRINEQLEKFLNNREIRIKDLESKLLSKEGIKEVS